MDFLRLANAQIWIQDAPGSQQLTMWHVAAFAWIACLVLHGGLSDMAIFRYAKRASYGYASAIGMFFGHYVAWVSAGIMGAATALLLGTTIDRIDSGELAYQLLGIMGVLAVVIAGWTTSNPTIYRAGLAFQTLLPRFSTRTVTWVTGMATSVIACFPFVFTGLIDLMSFFAVILAPIGFMIIAEHRIFPKLGLTRYWAYYRGLPLNLPMLVSWVLGQGVCWFCISWATFISISLPCLRVELAWGCTWC